MTMGELEQRLIDAGVPQDAYAVGRDRDERLCLVEDQRGYSVYYSERGQHTGEKAFVDEDEACRYFLAALSRMIG